jgi:repressor LexA
MTPKQKRVLEFIKRFIEKRGYAPTLQEIADEMRVCKITARQFVQALARQGIISTQKHGRRAIKIIAPEYQRGSATELPLLGRIAAGSPIEAVEVPETINISERITLGSGKKFFVLQVKGGSMIEDGILDGDYVIIEKREIAENGETVVALLDDGTATLKKFYKEKNQVKLVSANSRLKPIYVKSVRIQGAVKGVLRLVRK